MSLSIFERESNVAFLLLSTEILMKIRHFPYEMKYIIFLVERVLSRCLLPSITLFERMLTIGNTEAVIKCVIWYFPQEQFLLPR